MTGIGVMTRVSEHVLYDERDWIVGKVTMFALSGPSYIPFDLEWKVEHPGGIFTYYGSQEQLQRELKNMGLHLKSEKP